MKSARESCVTRRARLDKVTASLSSTEIIFEWWHRVLLVHIMFIVRPSISSWAIKLKPLSKRCIFVGYHNLDDEPRQLAQSSIETSISVLISLDAAARRTASVSTRSRRNRRINRLYLSLVINKRYSAPRCRQPALDNRKLSRLIRHVVDVALKLGDRA